MGVAGTAPFALALCVLGACTSQPETATSVRLTVRYDDAPAELRVTGTVGAVWSFGPTLLPDPPRALNAHLETVLLEVPDALDGSTLLLRVGGLDQKERLRLSGTAEAVIVRDHVIVARIELEPVARCATSGWPAADGGCGPSEPSEPAMDASVLDAGCDGSDCDTGEESPWSCDGWDCFEGAAGTWACEGWDCFGGAAGTRPCEGSDCDAGEAGTPPCNGSDCDAGAAGMRPCDGSDCDAGAAGTS